MATPFPFTQGQVLTAAQMNAITTLPINDQTASYTLVVGDVGKRVIMRKLIIGVADGIMKVDGKVIYEAKDLKVGLFIEEAAAALSPKTATA